MSVLGDVKVQNSLIIEGKLKHALPVEGGAIEIGGERFYRIVNYDAMAPFLMSLVSDSDHWMFVSSTGALTAGRRDPDHALFPYYTDDRIHDSQDQTGGKTILLVARGGRTAMWEPFSQRYEGLYGITRSLSKSVYSNKIIFEEVNHDLGLSFSCAWMTSDRFGFVRRATLVNLGAEPVEIDLLDGIQNLLPHGLTRRFQMEYSTLADGYKENELDSETGLGLFKLSSIPADRPEPNEALRATTVWSEGLEPARRLLSAAQLDRFRRGEAVDEETLIRGRRGAYFVNARVALPEGGRKEWSMVAEVDQDAAGVANLVGLLKSDRANGSVENHASAAGRKAEMTLGSAGLTARATVLGFTVAAPIGIDRSLTVAAVRSKLDEDIERGTRNLVRIVAAADGLQLTGDDLSSDRHFSNALFNVMRGGIPDRGYAVSRADFGAFLGKANHALAERQAAFLDALPETLLHSRLLDLAREQDDPDLERLAHEYLPLTFSRRHGDPSRPWNIFAIEVKSEHGERILNYQGNWRDIFQNWEALALSFPGYVESMIFKFAGASTADGYNPYRIMRDGFDWEVLDPHDAWSYIGYWGDHQVIYLLKLLEVSARYHPGAVAGLLTRRVFTYANVPYRIKPYSALLEDPRNTIDFDFALDREIRQRAEAMGADGKALPGADGAPYRVNLAEKLLVLVLARLFNYIPEAGLWMNTQRPEWNDANNALVGSGVSMVTLYFLRRFLSFCRGIFGGLEAPEVEVSAEVAEAFRRVAEALERHAGLLGGPISDRDRKLVLDSLGNVGSDYRAGLYAHGFAGDQTTLTVAELSAFCDVALRHIDHSIRANRRADGLYHAYNLMKVAGDGIVIRRLYEMLEGQMAVLSSGALGTQESVLLLDALRSSPLYRADQNSYVLYPDRKLPGFFEKNNIPAEAIAKSKALAAMIERDDRRIVIQDTNGVAHFNAAFRNSGLLMEALAGRGLPDEENAQILALYEEVFDHQSFTGRSGTFYKYEGLGCIYWHMVSKLVLAVQEVLDRAGCAGEDAELVERLRSHYYEIREGIGVHKPPELYGAIPTDPYSHTPGFAGVQQPGMTGQVKEDLIARLGEMGVAVKDGRLSFRRDLVSRGEFLVGPGTDRSVHAAQRRRLGTEKSVPLRTFHFYDLDGEECSLDLDPGTMAFTTCQTPVVAHRSGPQRIEITRADGSRNIVEGLELDAGISAAIFERSGAVQRLDVFFGFEGG